MTNKHKKGHMKSPEKERSKNQIITEQRKKLRKLVKENNRLRNEIYDLKKILDNNIRRIEELSERFTIDELLGIKQRAKKEPIKVEWDDKDLDEGDIDAIIKGDVE